MILDELVLHNFGVYVGRQTVQLTPSPNKPIILLGGMNGGGKTTLLDALQLVLFGPRARISSRRGASYDSLLKSAINKRVLPSEGAAIELEFRQLEDGREHTYRIHRSWSVAGQRARERLEVSKDGKLDSYLTENWQEQVEVFLPSRIAPLFFFDGEQIEGLADPSTASELLATAIKSLLGLDIVQKLKTDLAVLRRRKQTQLRSSKDLSRLELFEEELKVHRGKLAVWRRELGTQENIVDRLEKDVSDVEKRLQSSGLAFLENRRTIEGDRDRLTEEVERVEQTLREEIAGAAPFLLVRKQLVELKEQAEREKKARDADVLLDYLEGRDARVLDLLRKQQTDQPTVTVLERHFTADRAALHGENQAETYLDLTSEGHRLLSDLLSSRLPQTEEMLGTLLDDLERFKTELVDVERAIASMPDEASLREDLILRDELHSKLRAAKAQMGALEEEKAKAEQYLERKIATRDKEVHRDVDARFAKEDALRVVRHAERADRTLDQFATGIVQHHLRRIEALVLEGYNKLLRKKQLVRSLRIDPKSFRVHMMDTSGREVPTDKLSAGERQLLAVSLLWALGRRSGRPLPAVIDTPLGRLDSKHRKNLVTKYFPHASHQVVLLSTDEEIDEEHANSLRKWVTRSYLLQYDESRGGTHVEPGYFWDS